MYTLNYYPWLTQNVPPDVVHQQIERFAAEIAAALKAANAPVADVRVAPAIDVPEQIDQILGGDAQIGLMNPLGFAFARRRAGDIEAAAVAQRIIDGVIGITYFAQIYTRADATVADLAALAGTSIGYGTPYSTSNFLIPAHMLQRAGVHPLLGFSRVEFLKGHEIVARAVYEGKVTAGAGHDGVIIDLARQPGFEDASEKLVRIGRSPAIPSDPVVVNVSNTLERATLQAAIVAAGATDAGKEALKIFWGNAQGLAQTVSGAYEPLIAAMTDLRLTEADLLPRH